jgi:cytochrome c-type biogenesis protein CcmH
MTEHVTALRQQLQRLDEQLASGAMPADTHAQQKAALERQLLDAVLAAPAAPPPVPKASKALVSWLSVAVLVMAAGGYAITGSPGLPSAGAPGAATAQGAGADAPVDAAQFAAVVEQLAQKLKDQPNNAEGWAMLARSYSRLARPAEALAAYTKAVALNGDDPNLLADYADLMAFQNNRQLAGEPTQLIERALKLDPQHPKALALAGSAAFDRKDFAGAVRHWELLARLSPPGSEFLTELQSGIDEARKLGGLPSAPPVVAAAGPAPAAPATAGAGSQPAAAGLARITGTVTLAPALAAMAAPEDTVFVLARPAEGSRMPLAVARYRVKDLPVKFTLDDSMAMAPTARLSLFERVVVVARISKSGQAAPSPGDISGQTAPVANNATGLVVELSDVVKN